MALASCSRSSRSSYLAAVGSVPNLPSLKSTGTLFTRTSSSSEVCPVSGRVLVRELSVVDPESRRCNLSTSTSVIPHTLSVAARNGSW